MNMPETLGRTGCKVIVIANSMCRTKSLNGASLRIIAIVALCCSLGSCTSMDVFGGADKVDRSISTSSIPSKPKAGDPQSDEATVRNAVTSADLAKVGSNPLPWANSATGSAGVVSSIHEDRSAGLLCRAFTTSRHSYEGISLFSGQACRTETGDWSLTAFDRQ